ncbi:MAG: diacylglycerol kinase family protein [Patescibacteria group bacterium]|nr:diacylglycerol kinase family protein [Patescibacteria group bacterium]
MFKIKRLIKSFSYAHKGLLKTLHEEQNLKIQIFVAFIVLILAIYLHLSRLEFVILIIVIGLVILMEIANSALELVTDILKPRLDIYVKEVKDIAAAAVLVSSLLAIAVGVLIFWPHFFN